MQKNIQPETPGPSQESVWDYPRPPRVEPTNQRIRVEFNGVIIADSRDTLRVLETSHPPVYYIPPQDIQIAYLIPVEQRTYCEFKGMASYWTLSVNNQNSVNAAWSYANPQPGYEAIKDYVAFYPSRVDRCFVDEEQVQAQAGDFYGGWITSAIVGPFKGGPGYTRLVSSSGFSNKPLKRWVSAYNVTKVTQLCGEACAALKENPHGGSWPACPTHLLPTAGKIRRRTSNPHRPVG